MNCKFKFEFFIKYIPSQITIQFYENRYVDVLIVPNKYIKKQITVNFTIASFRSIIHNHFLSKILTHVGHFQFNQFSKQFISEIERLCLHSLACYDSLMT